MYNNPQQTLAGLWGFVAGYFAVIAVISAAITVLTIIGLWKTIAKTGEPGWKALIPILNEYVLCDRCWEKNAFWVMLGVALGCGVPVVNIICSIAMVVLWVMLCIRISAAFGKELPFAIGMIFLPPVFFMILGFGSSRYIGPSSFKIPTPVPEYGNKARADYRPAVDDMDKTVPAPRPVMPPPAPVQVPAPAPAEQHYHVLTVEMKNVHSGTVYKKSVKGSKLNVGRSASKSQLVIADDAKLSGAHIQLKCKDNTLYITDLESTNGTAVNGKKLTHTAPLKPTDTVTIGKAQYTIKWKYSLK
ncbi:MAG: DUF5684 domain-containing protein [Clostridia bacterium]|nr:DUF5684 domain-containing protein [Clostridia bacterium]